MGSVWLGNWHVSGARGRWAGREARARLRPGGRFRERDKVRGLRTAVMIAALALPGCAAAVVTGGAIVADEVIEQVEGGGDGLF